MDRPQHAVSIGEVFVLRLADPARLRLLLDTGQDLHEPLAAAIRSQLARSGPGRQPSQAADSILTGSQT